MKNNSGIIFEPDDHVYTVGGVIMPSVTGILCGAGFINTQWFKEEDSIRGTYVHKACHLHLTGGVDPLTLDGTIKPYFEGFLKFQKDSGFVCVESELMVFSKLYGYCGAMDLLGHFGDPRIMSIIDIKSGGLPFWASYQIAGYQIAYEEYFGKRIQKRFGLQLKKDGGYNLKEYKKITDRAVFKAAVTVENSKLGRL